MTGLKTKIPQDVFVDSCFSILESTVSDREKLEALTNYALQFEIATETELFNELLHSKKGQ